MISNAALNACLNGLSGVLLACGYAAIRAGKKGLHKAFMLSAVSVSSLFLISYLTYHIRVGKAVLFQGQGWIRPAYFTLLTSSNCALDAAAVVLRVGHRGDHLFHGLSNFCPKNSVETQVSADSFYPGSPSLEDKGKGHALPRTGLLGPFPPRRGPSHKRLPSQTIPGSPPDVTDRTDS